MRPTSWPKVLLAALGAALMLEIVVSVQNIVTLTNTRYNAESTGNLLTVPFIQHWDAAACDAGAAYPVSFSHGAEGSVGPTPGCNGAAATVFATLNFDDSSTESAYVKFRLPSDWTGALDLDLLWFTTATSGNVVWQISTFCLADNENSDPATFSYNAAQTITDAAKASTIFLNTASLSSLTTTGCAASELLFIKVLRNPAHASDTIAATALLVEVNLKYRRAM